MSSGTFRQRSLLYALALLVHLGVAALLTHPWDTFVFQRSISDLLTQGTTPYETALTGAEHIHLGRHLPALQHWWAYPPLPLILLTLTYWPAALGLVEAPWVARVLIKLPAILATLALAATARHFVADKGVSHAAAAQRTERWFLFNPLFILIAAVWGQGEALILVFLVLMVLMLHSGRWSTAGALWGLSLLVKPFSVFLAPLLGVHLAHHGGRAAMARFFGSGLVLATLVCLPFFLLEPRGFLQQTVFMHMERPPARLAPLAGLYYLLREASEAWPGVFPDPLASASIIGAVSLVLTLLVLLGLTLAFHKHTKSDGPVDLLYWFGVTFLGVLLTGKVLNEQYFLLPLGLLGLWWVGGSADGVRHRYVGTAVLAITWGVFTAGVLERAALLHWIPPDVLSLITPMSPAEVFSIMAWSLGLSNGLLQTLLGVVAGLAVAVSLLLMLRVVVPAWWEGWKLLVGRRVHLVRNGSPSRGLPVVVVVLLLLASFPVGTTILSLPASQADITNGDREDPRVLAVYRTDWYNPTHDPERQEGTWREAELTPRSGFLNPNAHKVQSDLGLMEETGIDGLLIVVHPQHLQNAATARRVAEAHGMQYAMALDLGLMESTRGIEQDDREKRLRETLEGPLLSGWTGPHHLRDNTTGAPYLFLRTHGPDLLERWQADVQDAVEEFHPSPILTTVQEGEAALGNDTSDPFAQALWLTTAAASLSGYRAAWENATEPDPPVIVVPWNEFDRGWAVEPTLEHGDRLLETTRQGIERLPERVP